MTDIISEGLRPQNLKGLIDSVVSIDQYKPKISTEAEVVVVAFSVVNERATSDLNNFIQTGAIEHLDVEPSPGPDDTGAYRVFVEFKRDKDLFKKIKALLDDITKITSDEGDWEFTAYKINEPRKFDEERFKRDIKTTPEEYNSKFHPSDAEKIKERMEFLVKY